MFVDAHPELHSIILPSALIYNLVNGNFTEFNALRTAEEFDSLFNRIGPHSLAKHMVHELSWQQVERVALEASKVFSADLVNSLLGSVVIRKIISSSKGANVSGIADAVTLADVRRVVSVFR